MTPLHLRERIICQRDVNRTMLWTKYLFFDIELCPFSKNTDDTQLVGVCSEIEKQLQTVSPEVRNSLVQKQKSISFV